MSSSVFTYLKRETEMKWNNMDEIISLSDFSSLDVEKEIGSFADEKLSDRFRRSFYYSPNKAPTKDTLSFSLTKEAVESFRKAAPAPFHKVGHHYAARVARDACVSPCAFLLALIYVERLARCNPDYLRNVSSSDLFIISMMVASKYLYDEGSVDEVYNDEWANSGMMETSYINELEAKFLQAIDWKVFVKRDEFNQTLQMLEARLALSNSLKRGWLSYTDMTNLLQSSKMMGGFKGVGFLLVQASFYCSVLYTSFISLWIWTLLVLHNKASTTIPITTSNTSLPHAIITNTTDRQLNSGDVGPVILTSSDGDSTFHYLHVTIENFNETLSNSALEEEEEPVDSVVAPAAARKPASSYSVMTLLETVFFLSTAIDTGPPQHGDRHGYPSTHDDSSNRCTNCGRNVNNQQQKKPTPTVTAHQTNPIVTNSFMYEALNPTCSLRDHLRSAVSPVVGDHAYQSPQNLLRDVTHYHCTMSSSFQPQHTPVPSAFDSRACLTALAAYLSPVVIRHWSVVSSVFCYLSILFLSAFVGYFSGKWYGVKDQIAFQ